MSVSLSEGMRDRVSGLAPKSGTQAISGLDMTLGAQNQQQSKPGKVKLRGTVPARVPFDEEGEDRTFLPDFLQVLQGPTGHSILELAQYLWGFGALFFSRRSSWGTSKPSLVNNTSNTW